MNRWLVMLLVWMAVATFMVTRGPELSQDQTKKEMNREVRVELKIDPEPSESVIRELPADGSECAPDEHLNAQGWCVGGH
jgi:hypothetical protein